MRAIMAIGVAALALAGCAPQAAISNLTTDQVVVVSAGDDNGAASMQTAAQGCAVHKRVAVPISRLCMDQWCFQKQVLFACKVPD